MDGEDSANITAVLEEMREGRADQSVLAHLVYKQLRRIARARMRCERHNHTLQPTALVNEAFMKLVGRENQAWQNRSHFYAVAAQVMRRILIDHAKAAKRLKRGGKNANTTLDFDIGSDKRNVDEILALDTALNRLQELDPRQSRVVELRYFAGMTEDEIADALGVSVRTVKRDWKMARIFLKTEMGGQTSHDL